MAGGHRNVSLILMGYLLGPTHLSKLGQKQDKYDKNKEKRVKHQITYGKMAHLLCHCYLVKYFSTEKNHQEQVFLFV